MRRLTVLFCYAVLLCSVAVPFAAFAADDMGNMPMPAATAAPRPTAAPMLMSAQPADSANPWRIATFALAAFAIAGIAVIARDRRPATIAMFAAAIVVVAALAFLQSRAVPQDGTMAGMDDVRGTASVPVTVVQIGVDPPGAQISAPANVAPYLMQTISARVPGVLDAFSAYVGDRVSAGQVVARLDEPELQNNAQAAAAAAQAAQSTIRSAQNGAAAANADISAARERVRYWNAEIARERSLLAAGAVSPQEYQDERAQAAGAQSAYDAARSKAAASAYDVQAAQAQAAQAAANAQAQSVTAGYTSVIAADDAIVTKRLVDPGTYVPAGTPILQVAVLNHLRVQAQVAQQDLALVHVGTPIDVVVGGEHLHGRISSISPVADPSTHTVIAEAIVPNDGATYQPGGYVRALLHLERPTRDSYSLPSAAIVGGERAGVWINAHGIAHRVAIRVLSDDGTTAQVKGDLRPGDRIIVTGAADLEEGQPVTETAQ